MARSPKLEAQLSIRPGAGAPFRKRWMDLLGSLESEGSITAAAKAVKLSYKAAWDAIAAMNNLSDAVLVERSVGGKGGGGARLTPQGKRLVATFRAVEAESERFVQRVNRRVQDKADIATLGRMTLLTSARNHFAGRIASITKGAVNDEVELKLPGGNRIVATITRESTQTLGLKKNGEAIALIKSSWIILGVEDQSQGAPTMKLSARNCLRGIVSRITRGAVNSEVVVDLGSGSSVVAVVTNASAKALGLAPGKPAQAIFKASSVILGVPG
ncbi:molybdate transport system regulatory protein [Panacagrimonas perspica]|uniref:Molybdate transport system regulatory protein n=1 Tax=Panacagrimonas perspica TaxID=381431 RepID=A0A4R7NSX9_9GAMM|nr:TOBE domain-containing protein [Panacagrimonas perspica]TDU24174.1 molybdate transport system regulatory protein [Panacagrimonas perspica]THD04586.1 molybdenum-dependent transcriptional regulator [Panacagrimonas perspica]